MILQAHRDHVRVVFSESKPILSNTAFHLISGGDEPYFIDSPDTNVWALAQTNTTSLAVTEFNTAGSEADPLNTAIEVGQVMIKLLISMNSRLNNISDNMALLNTYYADVTGNKLNLSDIDREYKL
jgi:hypothetical protein